MNTLYYGDNLGILRDYVDSESVDLVYLDPPFNSNRSYNVLFKEEGGEDAQAQITAFEDTWHWNQSAEQAYQELVTLGDERVSNMIGALREFIGANQMMAYLVMMAVRLVELHRVLKPTGSLYLHCDPTASHYLKVVLDAIFGVKNFRDEIIWNRTTNTGSSKAIARRFSTGHDVIFLYVKTNENSVFNQQTRPYSTEYVDSYYIHDDGDGKGKYQLQALKTVSKERLEQLRGENRIVQGRGQYPRFKDYLEDKKGVPIDDVWIDVEPVNPIGKEKLGYPTQKPLALLERIIQASSNEGDLVLDPFCGCGTTIIAAQKLGRHWIGIDITHLSIALQKYRLKDSFKLVEKTDYVVKGEPEDLSSARQLAHDDRYQFQWWALSLIKARPIGGDAKD